MNDLAFLTEGAGPKIKHLAWIGECIVTRRLNERTLEDELIIERADPKVCVAAEVLYEIAGAHLSPFARLDPPVPYETLHPLDERLVGRLLRIEAANRTVIYRLTEYQADTDWYLAEWPD